MTDSAAVYQSGCGADFTQEAAIAPLVLAVQPQAPAPITEVVAALLWQGDTFLICQRPAHKARALLWEFVGGKVEPGESPQQALVRECREELGITVAVGDVFLAVVHPYPDLTVHLTLYNATLANGAPQLLEHVAMAWISVADIPSYAFCPADVEILQALQTRATPAPLPFLLPQTARLIFRPLCAEDHAALREILGDAQTMYAWEHAFSEDEIAQWIATNAQRYATDGFGYCAALARADGAFLGMMGLLHEQLDNESVPGLGYLVARRHWGKGYATEGAQAFLHHALAHYGATRVIAEIRPENTASCRVAQRLGMTVCGEIIKQYRGKELPHLIYELHANAACFLASRHGIL